MFALPHRINSMARAWHFCFTASTNGAHDPLELKVTPMYLYVCTLGTRLPKTKSLRLLVSLPEITITAVLSGATLMHIRIFLAHFSRMAKLFWSLASESARSTMSSMYAKSIIRIEAPSGRSMSRPQSLSAKASWSWTSKATKRAADREPPCGKPVSDLHKPVSLLSSKAVPCRSDKTALIARKL